MWWVKCKDVQSSVVTFITYGLIISTVEDIIENCIILGNKLP